MARYTARDNNSENGVEGEDVLINRYNLCDEEHSPSFDYKEVLVFISDWIWFVSVISSLLYSTIGIVLAYVVLKDASNHGHPVHAFAGNFMMNLIGMKYGDIINNLTIFYVNLIAAFMNTLYVLTFHKYAQDQWTEIYMPMGYAIAVIFISFVYAHTEDPGKIKSRFGLLMVTLYIMYMSMPLLQLPEAIFTKDVTFISYPMNLMGFLMSFFWLLYAVVLENQYLTAANLVGLLITGVQLLVCVSLGIADTKLRT
ncbi:uncharacterized protein LOC108739939 [Agrilus planipennis]|uniref:Sugar transporter SWEET n=1 Tax=Agrilus planipennis TaxID=224129 RepID=A0A1W4X9Q8_AGRPL|nr:uncharacterized protein LOC108739939 [Agrilus planipennis]